MFVLEWGGEIKLASPLALWSLQIILICFSHVSQELREAINTMCNNASMYISKIRSNSGASVGPKPPHSFPQAMVSQVGRDCLAVVHLILIADIIFMIAD